MQIPDRAPDVIEVLGPADELGRIPIRETWVRGGKGEAVVVRGCHSDATHHEGCACHEARHARQVAELRAKLDDRDALIASLRATVAELRAWAAGALDPEDVADDVVPYMNWLKRAPSYVLDDLARAAQEDGQYE